MACAPVTNCFCVELRQQCVGRRAIGAALGSEELDKNGLASARLRLRLALAFSRESKQRGCIDDDKRNVPIS